MYKIIILAFFFFYCFYKGLECLIQYYTDEPNGLPTNLEFFCKGTPPPNHVRKSGPTNLLHRAIMEGNSV